MSRNKKRKARRRNKPFKEINTNVIEENMENVTEENTKEKNIFCAKLKKVGKDASKKILKLLVNFLLDFISLGLVFFVYGQLSGDNRSDNDLLKKQIDEHKGKGKITSIIKDDIHGFGNDSIIVTVGNQDFVSQDIQNKIIIMDTVQNETLHKMNDFLNLKSPYKVRFSYTLNSKVRDESVDLHPLVDSIIDMVGDSDLDKEIVVKYGVVGHKSTNIENVVYPAIFKYSYEKERYELIGTYPLCGKLNLRTYKEDGTGSSLDVEKIHTNFNDVSGEEQTKLLFFDDEKQFSLTEIYNREYRDFWIDSKIWGKVLVLAKLDYDKWTTLVNGYYPVFDQETKELLWYAIFSEEMEIPEGIFNEEIMYKLVDDLDDDTMVLME